MEQINNKLDNILLELDKMNKRLETIENKLNIINDSTNHMDNHIKFVENVYDKIVALEFHLENQACKTGEGDCPYFNICHNSQSE